MIDHMQGLSRFRVLRCRARVCWRSQDAGASGLFAEGASKNFVAAFRVAHHHAGDRKSECKSGEMTFPSNQIVVLSDGRHCAIPPAPTVPAASCLDTLALIGQIEARPSPSLPRARIQVRMMEGDPGGRRICPGPWAVLESANPACRLARGQFSSNVC